MTCQRIAQFEITGRIGQGGMGEVFRARDTRLNRDVAIKVLPKDFVSDADRLRLGTETWQREKVRHRKVRLAKLQYQK